MTAPRLRLHPRPLFRSSMLPSLLLGFDLLLSLFLEKVLCPVGGNLWLGAKLELVSHEFQEHECLVSRALLNPLSVESARFPWTLGFSPS